MKRLVFSRSHKVFTVSSVILFGALSLYLSLFVPSSFFKEVWKEVRIPDGVTYTEGINILKREGIIKNRLVLLFLGRITMTDRRLRAGYYNISTSMSTWDIFNRFRKGMIIEYAITIPEGSTMDEIRLKLAEKGLAADETWRLVIDRGFLQSMGIDAPSLEGYLYPDTYNFAKGMDTENILKIMVARLRQNLNAQLLQKAKAIGMSEKEVLTLASIIEREARADEERALISAVYHNRLKKNMRLQADPTTIYGVKRLGEKITRSDLRRRTPYNTYVIKGLPPGPIASAGIKSIRAALYPADTGYLYFVSKNDGTHHFSSTSEEHVRAVVLYQLSKKEAVKGEAIKTNDKEKAN
ncbi:MAG: endolytic transglycosylase MltG [Nitrospirae bacterium]|nr:endolytic transglycosylase MltG [Nitrospirota bacterium]